MSSTSDYVLSRRNVTFEHAEYHVYDDVTARLYEIHHKCHHFKVPSKISSISGKIYKVVGLSDYVEAFQNTLTIISFDDESEIEKIPTSFIFLCKSAFSLPPRIKRVQCSKLLLLASQTPPRIYPSVDNRFVSVTGKNFLINHHPHELVLYPTKKPHLRVRETVRIIGNNIMNQNQNIVSVAFPPSVENIGEYSFASCNHLRSITFSGNSRLKIIQAYAFTEIAIVHIVFPASVEEIGNYSFYKCKKLRSISFSKSSKINKIGDYSFEDCVRLKRAEFAEDSKLKIIGASVFNSTAIESIIIPSSVEEIGEYAFKRCKLKSVTFQDGSSLKKIKNRAFNSTKIESINIPPSVEEISQYCFCMCRYFKTVTFSEESKLKIIKNSAFEATNIESIIIPSSVEFIGNNAFMDCKNLSSVIFRDRENVKRITKRAFTKSPFKEQFK